MLARLLLSGAALAGLVRSAITARPAARGAQQPTVFFVAPWGDDASGNGTMSSPWASMGGARSALRASLPSMDADFFVYFRAGAYFVPETVTFAQPDSGMNGYTVHYAAYEADAANVVLHGGANVTGWTRVAGTALWQAPLPAGVSDARQVYIDGERMNATTTAAGIPGSVTTTAWGYTTTDALAWAFSPNQAQADIEFVYTGVGSSWTEARLRVQSVAPLPGGGANVTMQQPGFSLGRNKPYNQGVTAPASIQNVFALLGPSTPGQYYLNSAAGVIYYVPRPQDDMATASVVVPSTDVLVALQGNRTGQPAIAPVHHLAFEGLTFSYAGWLEPNTGLGYVDLQSGFRILPNSSADDSTWVPVPANVQMRAVQNVSVVNCTFTHLGATGLSVDDGSQSVVVANNTFRDISCGGVYVGQVNDANLTDATRMNAHQLVYNNLFDGVPVEYHDCAALLGGYLVNLTISHNTIQNNANTGISLGWGWSRDEATNAGYNAIVDNYVYGSNWLLVDGGSIYVLGPQPASVMAGNYVSNQRHLFGALYTDEGSAYWHITRNVVNNVPEWLHIWTPSIHDEVVDFCWTNQPYQDVHGTNITINNITIVPAGQPFPDEALAIIANAGVLSQYGPKP